MQLRHLRYFVRIVEAGSFSRAAATIHVAQPALSQQIAELEEELGVSLLHRSTRGVRPTAAGETLFREAAAILQQMEQLPGKVRSTGGEAQGAVNLGMTSTLAAFLSVSFMEACRIALPKVELRFITGHSLLIASRIEARTLDFGIVFEDEHAPIPGFLRQPLLRQRLFLVGRKRRQNRPAPVSGIIIETRANSQDAAVLLASLLTHYLIHYGYAGRKAAAGMLANASFTITDADATNPAILLRTVDRDPQRLVMRHQQEIDRITALIAPKAVSLMNLDAADAYEWSLYHLLQNEEIIKDVMFPVTYYRASGAAWTHAGSELTYSEG
jgi:DNA-binding transcriptional LysR family regulator